MKYGKFKKEKGWNAKIKPRVTNLPSKEKLGK